MPFLFVVSLNLNHLTGLDGIATHSDFYLCTAVRHLNHLTGLDGIATDNDLMIALRLSI